MTVNKDILARGDWSLYKLYWKTDPKLPKVLIPADPKKVIGEKGWTSATLMYNPKEDSINDPFGWNINTGLEDSIKKLLHRALIKQKQLIVLETTVTTVMTVTTVT
jgi:hypothetical protein